jgi:hypothetical protein
MTTSQSQLLSRLNGRRRERGAALVEAAFMFPMFVILFYAIIYAHTFYSTQLDSNAQSRQLAWNDAMSDCGKSTSDDRDNPPSYAGSLTALLRYNFTKTGNGQGSPIHINTNEQTPTALNGEASDAMTGITTALAGGSVEGALGAIIGPIINTVASFFPDPNGSQAVAKGNFNWRMPNNYNGDDPNNTLAVHQTVTVMCNETPQNGSAKTVIGDIVGDIVSWVQNNI